MTETSSKRNRFDETIIIVGGGPSGASAAKGMADRGYTNVHLCEAYPHPETISKTSYKAYGIALSPRGQQGILDATGINIVEQASSRKLGVLSSHLARHVYNPKTQQTSSKARPSKGFERVVVKRQDLSAFLLDEAAKSGVTIHYEHKLMDIDFKQKVAVFETPTLEKKMVPYDLLIGADGSNSTVRNLMVDNLADFDARTAQDSMEYQVVVLPKNPFSTTHPENTTHSWNHKQLNAISLGFPVQDKAYEDAMLFAVVFPEGQLESFRTTGYESALTKLLPDVCHDAATLKTFETQLRSNPIGNGGLCVWSSSLGHATSGILLLGDSGHGMWPSLGQGANCALESVGVFCQCLDELENTSTLNECHWTSSLIDSFCSARLEDAKAAVDLTYGGVGARESRGRMNAPLSHRLQLVGMMLLHKLSFGIIAMPALLRLLMGTPGLSYSRAKQLHFQQEKYICVFGLVLLLALLVLAVQNTILGESPFLATNHKHSSEL